MVHSPELGHPSTTLTVEEKQTFYFFLQDLFEALAYEKQFPERQLMAEVGIEQIRMLMQSDILNAERVNTAEESVIQKEQNQPLQIMMMLDNHDYIMSIDSSDQDIFPVQKNHLLHTAKRLFSPSWLFVQATETARKEGSFQTMLSLQELPMHAFFIAKGADTLLVMLTAQVNELKEWEMMSLLKQELHDLANTLSSIHLLLGAIEKLADITSSSAPDSQLRSLDTTQMLNKVKLKLAKAIESCRAMYSVEEPFKEPELQRIPNLNALIQDLEIELARIAADSKLQFLLDLTQLPLPVDADPALIERVIVNLVGNAIKYTEQGWVKVQTDDCASHVCIKVTDTGQGIPPDQLPHIFKAGYRVKGTKRLGTGLGLASVAKIIQQHHGEITVESKEGKGSTFTILLPKASMKS